MTDLKTDWETGDTYHPEDANTLAEYVNAAVAALTALTIAAYVKPGDGIPIGDLSVAVQSALAAATAAYQKPVNGISSADMAAAVQASLTKADSAVQPAALDVVAAAAEAARNRANHTGQQTSASISDLTEAVQDIVAGFLAQGANITLTYDDAGNTLTVGASGGGGGADAETIRDTIGASMVGLGNISVSVNDAADTITITTTATVNSTDAALRDRGTHTGTQSADTIVDGATNKVFTAADRAAVAGIAASISAAIAAERSAVRTLTNARINPRVLTLNNQATVNVDSDAYDLVIDSGLTANVTLANPTGTPVDGQRLRYALTGTATRTITHGTAFEASSTISLPLNTNGTNRTDIEYIWNVATSKWRIADEIPAASYRTGGTDVPVADGGTGRSSHTAYAPIVGGTTSTGAQQSVASAGTAGQVLKSGGAAVLPVYGDARTHLTINTAVTLAAVAGSDYVYFLDTGALPTMPTAVGNVSLYYLCNKTGSAIDIASTSGQQINGAAAPFSLPAGASVILISDTAGWRIF